MNNKKSTGVAAGEFLLNYHLILECFGHQNLFHDPVLKREAESIFLKIANAHGFHVEIGSLAEDKADLVVEVPLNLSLLQIVQSLKNESSQELWSKAKSALTTIYPESHSIWAEGYFASSI